MRLPLLPLRPTAAPGDGATPPALAAAAAMDEAWGDAEMAVVRSILTNIKAGDEEGAEKLACDAVANFLSTNGRIHRLGAEDAIWATLLRNVFPDAPKVDMNMPIPARTPDPPPPNNRAFFYLMCRRYKRWRKLRKKVERQAKVVAAAHEAAIETYNALIAYGSSMRRQEPWETPYQQIQQAHIHAYHVWNQHREKLKQLELWRDQAEEELTQWTAVAAVPRVERQGALGPPRGLLDLPPPSELTSDEEGADAALHGDED
jgi:hypothetical protein